MTTRDLNVVLGSQFYFRDSTDFDTATPAPATAANSLLVGTPSGVQLDLTGVSGTNGGRASAKVDLGTPWAKTFVLGACVEWETAPTDGGEMIFYWADCPITTAGTGNPAGLSGSDEAVTWTEGLRRQLVKIGSLWVRNNVINISPAVGILRPQYQFGILAVEVITSTSLRSTATAMDETHITLTEVVDQLQDEV